MRALPSSVSTSSSLRHRRALNTWVEMMRQPSSAAGLQPLSQECVPRDLGPRDVAHTVLEGPIARHLSTKLVQYSPEAVLSHKRAFFEPSARALTLCFPIVYAEMTTRKGGKRPKLDKRHQNTTTTNPKRWEMALKEEWMRGPGGRIPEAGRCGGG